MFTDDVVRLFIGTFTIVGAVWSQAWWLSGKFKEAEDRANNIGKNCNQLMSAHENKDQERHVEFLNRFERISIALAKLGAEFNGKHG